MLEWETVNENSFHNVSCRLDRIEVEEGYIYRHMTYRAAHDAAHPQVTLCFVEKKRKE